MKALTTDSAQLDASMLDLYEEFKSSIPPGKTSQRIAYSRVIWDILCERASLGQPIQSISTKWLAHYLLERYASPGSRRQASSASRKFFSWLTRNGHIQENPARFLRCPPLPAEQRRSSIVPLSIEDVGKLLDSARGESLADRRDLAMLAVVIAFHLDFRTLAALKVSDYRHDAQGAKIRLSFAGRPSWVAVPQLVSNALDAYVKAGNLTSGELFRTIPGKKKMLTDKAVSMVDVSRILHKRFASATLASQVSFRVLRASSLPEAE